MTEMCYRVYKSIQGGGWVEEDSSKDLRWGVDYG